MMRMPVSITVAAARPSPARHRPGLLSALAVLALFGVGAPAPAGAWVDAWPVNDPVQAPLNSTVLVQVILQNQSDSTVYINSLSSDLPEEFAGTDPFADFFESGPDSLLPGEGWEGPLLRLTISPDAPVSSSHPLSVVLSGGEHPWEDVPVVEVAFTLDDSLSLSGVAERPTRPGLPPLVIAPNPSSGSTTIRFDLRAPDIVQAVIHDVRGASVRNLFRGPLGAGPQSLTWDGRDDSGRPVPPGLYFVRLRSPDGLRHTKVIRY